MSVLAATPSAYLSAADSSFPENIKCALGWVNTTPEREHPIRFDGVIINNYIKDNNALKKQKIITQEKQ